MYIFNFFYFSSEIIFILRVEDFGTSNEKFGTWSMKMVLIYIVLTLCTVEFFFSKNFIVIYDGVVHLKRYFLTI